MTECDNRRVFSRAALSSRTVLGDGNDVYLTVQ